VKAIEKPPARLRRVTSGAAIRYQPRLGAGHARDRVNNLLEDRINERAKEEAAHLGVSKNWLIATILADAFRINLDKKLRAYKGHKDG